MKILFVTATLFLISSSVDMTERKQQDNVLDTQNLLACYWYPLCDPQLQSPLLQPKDKKTETHDTKDNKLA